MDVEVLERLPDVEVVLVEDADGGAGDVAGGDVMEALQPRAFGQETDDVARAVQVHPKPQIPRHPEVVDGGEVMGRGQALPQRVRVAVGEAEPGLRDVADHDVGASTCLGMRGFDLGEPLARRFQEPRLHEAAEPGLRRQLHEPRQQPQADEAREPGEQHRARSGAFRHGVEV
jgi:hypothetical protein